MLDGPFPARVSFEIAFQAFRLFLGLHGYGGVDFPWGKFGCMVHLLGIVGRQAGMKVVCVANVKVRVRGCIPEDVCVEERHGVRVACVCGLYKEKGILCGIEKGH